jgi:glutaredoxin-related protein
MNTLYFSNHCPHCKTMFDKFDTDNFNKVCIDKMNPRNIPSYVTMVPTVVTSDKTQKYEGKDVFEYMRMSMQVEPYAFDMSNNTNKGFSFLGSDVYTEQKNYYDL